MVGGLPSYSSCEGWTVQDAPMHWSTTTTCELPSDGGYNWTLVAESAHSGEIAYKHWHQFCKCDSVSISSVLAFNLEGSVMHSLGKCLDCKERFISQ